VGACAISTQVPLLRSHPALFFAGLFYGIAQGISPAWLFQGLERMAMAAAFEVAGKLAGLAAIFLFVRAAADSWKVVVFYSLAPVLTCGCALWMMYRQLRLRFPTVPMIRRALKIGWPMFLLRGGMATYSVANVLILALFAPVGVVGYYASAAKLSQAIGGLLMPIRDAFYPRLSHLATRSPKENERLTRISAVIESGCGAMLSILTWACAGILIKTVFGPSFAGAAPILQILAVLPLIFALTDAIGFQTLLPAGKESLLTKGIVAGGLINCVMAFLLAPRFQASGMAWSVVMAEAAICVILVCIVARTTNLFRGPEPDPLFTAMLADGPGRTHK
jgi:PST family polysaccharide transporter